MRDPGTIGRSDSELWGFRTFQKSALVFMCDTVRHALVRQSVLHWRLCHARRPVQMIYDSSLEAKRTINARNFSHPKVIVFPPVKVVAARLPNQAGSGTVVHTLHRIRYDQLPQGPNRHVVYAAGQLHGQGHFATHLRRCCAMMSMKKRCCFAWLRKREAQ